RACGAGAGEQKKAAESATVHENDAMAAVAAHSRASARLWRPPGAHPHAGSVMYNAASGCESQSRTARSCCALLCLRSVADLAISDDSRRPSKMAARARGRMK